MIDYEQAGKGIDVTKLATQPTQIPTNTKKTTTKPVAKKTKTSKVTKTKKVPSVKKSLAKKPIKKTPINLIIGVFIFYGSIGLNGGTTSAF